MSEDEIMTPHDPPVDYLSRRPASGSFLIAAGTILFIGIISQLYWENWGSLADLLPGSATQVFEQHEYWRLFTATLIHGDWQHFLSNAYMLGILGFFVYGYFGFSVFPFYSYVLAGLVNALSLLTYPANVKLIGASGWVYLLAGTWLTLYILIERNRPLFRRLMRATGVGAVILLPSTFEPQTSYRAHAIGFAVGVALGFVVFALRKKQIFVQTPAEEWENIEVHGH